MYKITRGYSTNFNTTGTNISTKPINFVDDDGDDDDVSYDTKIKRGDS